MPRRGRKKSSTGYYHVILRGINKNDLYLDQEDKGYFLKLLMNKMEQGEYVLLAYCLMDNHVHLLLQEGTDEIAVTMKRINISYARYFNKKYERVGPVFQDRFRSEGIKDDRQLLAVVRYIHQNPLKAGMVGRLADYRWSSYREYTNIGSREGIVSTAMVMGLLDDNEKRAIKAFVELNAQEVTERFMDMNDQEETKQYGIGLWEQMNKEKIAERERIRLLRKKTGLATRTLATITGISRIKIMKELR